MAGIPSIANINRFNESISSSSLGLSLDLQFAADKTLTARKGPTPVLTRANATATFVGSDGLIQSAAVNQPRFDHDPVTRVCKGLLIEESRTNQSLRSEAIVDNIGWSLVNTTSVVSGTSPNGNSSYQISETTTSANHLLVNTGGNTVTAATSVVSGASYTGSIFVKKVVGSVDWVQLTFSFTGFGTSQFANFNISNGTVGNYAFLTSGTVPRIEEFPNGWYRCSITASATATTSSTSNIVLSFINNIDILTRFSSYPGSTLNSVLASLCQFEAGSFPTSYIPTVSSSLIRNADACSITGSNFTNFYNFTEGTMFVVFSGLMTTATGGNRGIASISDGTYTNNIQLVKSSGAANIGGDMTNTNPQFNFSQAGYVQGGTQKIACAFAANNAAFSFNGGISTDNTVVLPTTLTNLAFRDPTGVASGQPTGHIQSFRYFRKRLPDAKLITLTT